MKTTDLLLNDQLLQLIRFIFHHYLSVEFESLIRLRESGGGQTWRFGPSVPHQIAIMLNNPILVTPGSPKLGKHLAARTTIE